MRRECGGGRAAAAPDATDGRMASVRAAADSVPRGSSDRQKETDGATERERVPPFFARSPGCNFQSSESKSGILSSPIDSTNFERKREERSRCGRRTEWEEMGK